MTETQSNIRTIPPSASKLQIFSYKLAWLALTVLLAVYAMRPIMDLDFWWHLKTGELILQNRALLSIDPFNYTGNPTVSGREAVILNGYWLWQITAATLYRLWGFNGIFLLKLATATLLGWTAFREMSRLHLSNATRLLLATLGALVVITIYNLERPQVLSFLFLTMLIGMIARIRNNERPNWLLIPLMLIWSNIHGGFVVGDLVLGLAAAGFIVQYRHYRNKLIGLITWAGCGTLASFANPNGWNAFLETFNFLNSSIGTAFIAEYRSSLFVFTNISSMAAICIWLISLATLAGLAQARPRYWPDILIGLFIVVFGNRYLRNAGFIAVALLPLTGYYTAVLTASIPAALRRYAAMTALLVSGTVIAILLTGEIRLQKSSTGPVAGFFTTAMADYLKTSSLTGNMFNDFGMGGYLNWSLYPQRKTFIDNRELNTEVSRHYLDIALGNQTYSKGKPLYELLLDNYQIDLVAMRLSLPNGELQPLLKLLFTKPEWVPVFLDWNSFVLARQTDLNAEAIRMNAIDKSDFLAILARTASDLTKSNPDYTKLTARYNDIRLWQESLQSKLLPKVAK